MRKNRILMLALILFVGVILILDQFGPVLEAAFSQWIYNLQVAIANFSNSLLSGNRTPMQETSFSLSGLLLWVFIALVVFYILGEVRYNLQKTRRWTSDTCPKCGGKIHRVHRTSMDRFFNWLLLPHAHRYECSNHECNWTGLLQGRPQFPRFHDERSQSTSES
jgi:hypothetical protein